ncbi:MAG TPA: four helix bundle protein [Bacteroidales bacterium]|nr:four helix bundle protein [Bacteroidales bacterium]
MSNRVTYKFEKLEVWLISLELSDVIYEVAKMLPKSGEFNLKSQILRAGTSISLNIAEGSTASTNPEQIRYIKISLRSLIEVIACLRLIERRKYSKDEVLMMTADSVSNKLFAKLNAFIKSFN